MNRERWQQVKAILGDALDLPSSARRHFLLESCGGDVDLGREVDSLLAAYTEGFLEDSFELELELEPPEGPTSLEGRGIQDLRIGERIGAGGVGEVYVATVIATGERIAVKRLAGESVVDPKRVARFRQEARAAMALHHPNAVRVRGLLEEDGEVLILMDLVSGKTLRQLLEERRLSTEEALDYAIAVAAALARAHDLGIVHRDVKPENIMVSAEGGVKLLDFGIAKLVEAKKPEEAPTRDLLSLSREGLVLGSVSYMSPEQIRALPVDGRSDVFSLGSVLYEMVTGTRAFGGATILEIVSRVLKDEPALPDSLGVLKPVVRKALAKDPSLRFDSMTAFQRELGEIGRRA